METSQLNKQELGSCQLSDLRFTVSVYASVEVSENGEVDELSVRCSLQDCLNEWQPDKDPYWCCGCDAEFRSWEGAKAHLGVTA